MLWMLRQTRTFGVSWMGITFSTLMVPFMVWVSFMVVTVLSMVEWRMWVMCCILDIINLTVYSQVTISKLCGYAESMMCVIWAFLLASKFFFIFHIV